MARISIESARRLGLFNIRYDRKGMKIAFPKSPKRSKNVKCEKDKNEQVKLKKRGNICYFNGDDATIYSEDSKKEKAVKDNIDLSINNEVLKEHICIYSRSREDGLDMLKNITKEALNDGYKTVLFSLKADTAIASDIKRMVGEKIASQAIDQKKIIEMARPIDKNIDVLSLGNFADFIVADAPSLMEAGEMFRRFVIGITKLFDKSYHTYNKPLLFVFDDFEPLSYYKHGVGTLLKKAKNNNISVLSFVQDENVLNKLVPHVEHVVEIN